MLRVGLNPDRGCGERSRKQQGCSWEHQGEPAPGPSDQTHLPEATIPEEQEGRVWAL